MESSSDKDETVVVENARTVSNRDLPPIEPKNKNRGSILLFYQYVEPVWTNTEHKQALKKVIELGKQHDITGRGRVAPEGLNCTLTGMPERIRSFCYELRKWNSLFHETDFKITDGVDRAKLFKSLSIRKAEELVAYGLSGDKAPSLNHFSGTHLEADDFHKAMQDPETVIIDVRNAYESAIGHFKPPKGGATLIDPKMRNSIEFPKWLSSSKTQEQINGKKVLMYCTGGIRCERATALLNQMSVVQDDLKPKGVYHCRGGIERYVKTFPDGGFWNGKNYLFDRRMEQTPVAKENQKVESDIDSKCCLCRVKWTVYRNQFKCSFCKVPVIVCDSCNNHATTNPGELTCELCKMDYRAPNQLPDLVSMKRKAEEIVTKADTTAANRNTKQPKTYYNDRLFLRKLPLTVSASKIKESIGADRIKFIRWLSDYNNGGFYGSAILVMVSKEAMQSVLNEDNSENGIVVGKKKIKVSEVFKTQKEDLIDFGSQKEYPPIGFL